MFERLFEGELGVLGFLISVSIIAVLGNEHRNKSKDESKLLANIMLFASGIYLFVLVITSWWKHGF